MNIYEKANYDSSITGCLVSVVDLGELLFLEGSLENMDACKVVALGRVLDPRLHQVAHDHLVLKVFQQDALELRLLEEILVVLQVDARLSLDSLHDLESVKLGLAKVLPDVVEERGTETGQEVLGWVLLSLRLLHLL